MSCCILRTNPVLPVRDISATAEFYTNLGFINVLYQDDQYLVIAREGFQLHFRKREVMKSSDAQKCHIHVDKVDAFRISIGPEHFEHISKISLKPTGLREFSVQDPDGNQICFGEVVMEPV
ncbi:MAG: putative lactoylglutathione lyase [Limisphaerales bacterium]|jgi:predicted lactoylglutathione lyase